MMHSRLRMNETGAQESVHRAEVERLRVLHVGADPSPQSVNGVSMAVWGAASRQAMLGHEVTLLLSEPPDGAGQRLAAQTGLNLITIPASGWSYDPERIQHLLEQAPPQVVHFHSVFILRQARLAAKLSNHGIPYVITPHGGISPIRLARGRLEKVLYSLLIERWRFHGAAAVTVVTPGEVDDVRSFVPRYRRGVRWIPNPVEESLLEAERWTGSAGPKRLVFLGRFDVYVKGIDILVEVARHLRDVSIDLYGTEDSKTMADMERLRRNLPPNVKFHAPIFGAEKIRVLTEATMYIQTARAEGFPISVAEAMYLGVPCAVAGSLTLAQLFRDHDLGLLLPPEPQEAAEHIAQALANPELLREWSQRAGAFARRHFHPQTVANRYLELYRSVLTN